MKVAIVGSRQFKDYSQLHLMMNKLRKIFPIDEIISGGAVGADDCAEIYAKNYKIPITIIKPDWDKHGKSAGMIRNGEIIKAANFVVAFWDGRSRGTKDSIDRALKAKKRCFVFFTLHKKAMKLPKDISDALLADPNKQESTNNSVLKNDGCDSSGADVPCCETPGTDKCDQCQETGLADPANH